MNDPTPTGTFRNSLISEAGKWLVVAIATSLASVAFIKKDVEHLQTHASTVDSRIDKIDDKIQDLQREVWRGPPGTRR